MTNIRQSEEYAQFIRNLGWQVEKVGQWNVFIKKFPLIGSLIKIQRIVPPIPFEEIEILIQKHRAFQIILEPSSPTQHPQLPQYPQGYCPLKDPYIPTKTLIKDINGPEKEIFDSFSKNKRRDIRLAEKNQIIIKEGLQEEMIKLKKMALWKKRIFPLGTSREIIPLCEAFGEKAKILIAYSPNLPNTPKIPNSLLAGALLLFHEKTAYYWQAAATDLGKKLLAPTLIVWEAIKLAKGKGCKSFDFEGVYDPRFPKNKSWQGFTHFKEGFRGKEVIYPQPLIKTNNLLSTFLLK